MIAEPILNAILHLFAITTLPLNKIEQELAKKNVLSYLENHIGLTDAGIYIDLYQELIEAHQDEEDNVLISSAERIANQLKTLLQESEKYVAIVCFAELAVISDSPLPVQIVKLIGRKLALEEQFVEQMLLFIRNPISTKNENIKLLMQNHLSIMRSPEKKLYFLSPTKENIIEN
ncbi:MAG: hypothetical protein HQK51_20310, partial [Oligoflexia bacterium]|nr:hypothetical protein [Oligoflexia bacterium]